MSRSVWTNRSSMFLMSRVNRPMAFLSFQGSMDLRVPRRPVSRGPVSRVTKFWPDDDLARGIPISGSRDDGPGSRREAAAGGTPGRFFGSCGVRSRDPAAPANFAAAREFPLQTRPIGAQSRDPRAALIGDWEHAVLDHRDRRLVGRLFGWL